MLDTKNTLDELLADWHIYCKGHSQSGYPGACAMFKDAKSSKQWDSTTDIHEDIAKREAMKAIDFAVFDCMRDPFKAAIIAHAHNLATGHAVWTSPRLPTDRMERIKILNEAVDILTGRLKNAGIL